MIVHENAIEMKTGMQTGWTSGILDWDFATVVLKYNVKFTNEIQPICLPTTTDYAYSGKHVVVSGWGNTAMHLNATGSPFSAKKSDVLKQTGLFVVNENTCRQSWKVNFNENTMICAYGAKHFNKTIVMDACQGDSGGNVIND